MKNYWVAICLLAIVAAALTATTRDGFWSPAPVSDTDPSLFMFSNTKASTSCCGSSVYTSSDGCLCVNPDQIKYINTRGGNRTSGDF